MFATSQHVHFIGIGGIGMSGIAEILLSLGMKVSGSDLRRGPVTDRLARLGAAIHEGHDAGNVAGATVVVTSSAVTAANPEVIEAHARKIPVIQRAEMLAELMRLKYGIAIAGMHGKTTTTSMVAAVLSAGGLDPTVVVGGRVDALGSNAWLGTTQYLVAEADESDRSFLKLSPILAVVTNLDREHMDCYRDMQDVEQTFVEFMDRVPFYGMVVACWDNQALRALLPRVQRRVVTYGLGEGADFRITPGNRPTSANNSQMWGTESGGELVEPKSTFEVNYRGRDLGEFHLRVPGAHNVLNATAAIAVGVGLDVATEEIRSALDEFRGVDRRFQVKGSGAGVTVIDDYGHHPTEIKATLAAARECGYRRVLVVFQPHRYTRTQLLMEDFAEAFRDADAVFMLDIYAASEAPIAGVTSQVLAARVRDKGGRPAEYVAKFDDAMEAIAKEAQAGDMVLTLGAGNVSQLGPMIVDRLSATY